jgi:periplasmic mercuric ion binding protein
MRKKQIIALLVFALVMALSSLSAFAMTQTVTIKVEGMHCGNCASSVEKKLKATPGVEEVRVSYDKKEAWVKFDDQKVTEAQLREPHRGSRSRAWGAGTVAAALFARLQSHRAVLVKDQELPARGEGPHERRTEQSVGTSHQARNESRHPRLVQTLRLLVSTRVKDAIVINSCSYWSSFLSLPSESRRSACLIWTNLI